MNTRKTKHRKGFTLVELLVVIAIIVSLAALATPQIFKALKRAALAEALSNVRQVKFALDGFSNDFDGQYPNTDTAEKVEEGGGSGSQTSNDYFRQLFMSGVTQSETIFWVKNSPVASKSPPDDKVTEGGKPQSNLILQPGDCHWAYVTEQTNTSNVARPLVVDGYKRGTTEYDPELWDRKAIVLRIDGSARALRMRLSDGAILDGSNKDLLSTNADAWDGSGEAPEQLLKQPQPRTN
jgi:prepilin-type N-terminal cleavage/methylation domain-containing protein